MNSNNKRNDEIQEPFSSFEKMNDIDLKKKSKYKQIKNFIYRKRIYIIIGSIFLLTIIIIIIATNKKNNKITNKKKQKEKKEEYDPISKYYSQKTKNYLNLISSLEKDNYSIYQYDFQNNSKGSFANKYQYLYENDTSLIPNNS